MDAGLWFIIMMYGGLAGLALLAVAWFLWNQ